MSEKRIHRSRRNRSRRAIAAYLRRLASALGRGEPVPTDEEQTVTVDPPAEPDLAVEVQREGDQTALAIEMEWPDEAGETVETGVTASQATFELYEDAGGDSRWRLRHRNGNVIADSSQGYASKQKAKQGLESVRSNAPGAAILDQSRDDGGEPGETGDSKADFELYADKAEKWRWRLVHRNGRIVADSGQGYASKQKAKQGLRSVRQNVRGAPVETED
jgi:amphi-Trp domain-containing protein